MASLIKIKPDIVVEVPDSMVEFLEEFANMMPPESPNELPPRRAVDHKIELEPGAKPPVKAPYRMPTVTGTVSKSDFSPYDGLRNHP